MFSRYFRPFIRSHRHVWLALHVSFRRFILAGFSNRYCLRGVATLTPLLLLRSAHCKPKEKDDQEANRPTRKRNMSKVKYETSLEGKARHYLNSLKVRWEQLHQIPGIFEYQLQKSPQVRLIPGSHGFYAELNTERSVKRRSPQTIENLNPSFKPKHFNFNKVDALEVMMTIDEDQSRPAVQMIINKSPLSKYHTLICPEVEKNHVQRLNREALAFCITFMRNIDDRNMRMGYNSPGALASVNHLHFHLLHMPKDLYVDTVAMDELVDGYVYRLSRRAPTEAICVVFGARDSEEDCEKKVGQLYELAMWMCKNNMPHNLFITPDRRPGKNGDVLVFVFARSEYCANKELTAFNVGFCELAGYIPLPGEEETPTKDLSLNPTASFTDQEKMKNITEAEVLRRIRSVIGDAPKAVYEEITKIVEGRGEDLLDLPFTI
ncbi:hypothetical protein KR009_002104 [Drosophila setifemur]|nr:hypothetical protein KR009_002104 [Drosophila setifemur]